jgi:hypothetical protein
MCVMLLVLCHCLFHALQSHVQAAYCGHTVASTWSAVRSEHLGQGRSIARCEHLCDPYACQHKFVVCHPKGSAMSADGVARTTLPVRDYSLQQMHSQPCSSLSSVSLIIKCSQHGPLSRCCAKRAEAMRFSGGIFLVVQC